jgi:hypothetical protein
MKTEIQCRECGNKEFELNFTAMDDANDCKRSIIAICKCGRMVKYFGVEQAVEISIKEVISTSK